MTELPMHRGGPARPLSPEQLADHQAVGSLCKIYALGMDGRDFDLVASAFAPDAVIVGQNGNEPFKESMGGTFAFASSFKATQHLIGQQYVDLDGDDALCISYGVAHHKVAAGEDRDEIIAGVQYHDRCRRSDDGWRIVERSIVSLWVDVQPPRSKV